MNKYNQHNIIAPWTPSMQEDVSPPRTKSGFKLKLTAAELLVKAAQIYLELSEQSEYPLATLPQLGEKIY